MNALSAKPAFSINGALDLGEYSDCGIVTSLVDTHGVRLRLQLTAVTSQLLRANCQRAGAPVRRIAT